MHPPIGYNYFQADLSFLTQLNIQVRVLIPSTIKRCLPIARGEKLIQRPVPIEQLMQHPEIEDI
jgi:hypothetical protein